MRKRYDNDFKVMIVELLNSGRTVREITEEYGVESSSIRRWGREFKEKSGDFSKKRELTTDQIALKQIQKELKEITLERDILKKAVSIFSKSDR
jgi:transposase